MKFKPLKILFAAMILLCAAGLTAGAQSRDAILERLDKILSELSDSHKYIFYEYFPDTGVREVQPGEIKADYSLSASDKDMYEKELNHYLSQLGVGHVSLPDALEFKSEDVELMGKFGVEMVYPKITMAQYCQDLERGISPFKPSDKAEISTESINLLDIFEVVTAATPKVEGERYAWQYARNGVNHWLTLEDTGGGYILSLTGINSLEEYNSGPAARPQSSGGGSVVHAGSGVEGISLGDTYTIWVKTATHWYVNVRKGRETVYLKLALKSNGDMNYSDGTGWYAKPSGGGFAKYSYSNGKWGAASTVSWDALDGEIRKAEQEYILVPSGNMAKDKVKLNQKSAYFDDLDISLP